MSEQKEAQDQSNSHSQAQEPSSHSAGHHNLQSASIKPSSSLTESPKSAREGSSETVKAEHSSSQLAEEIATSSSQAAYSSPSKPQLNHDSTFTSASPELQNSNDLSGEGKDRAGKRLELLKRGGTIEDGE